MITSKQIKRGLATLLEGTGYLFDISIITIAILNLLWCKKCVKLENVSIFEEYTKHVNATALTQKMKKI